MSYFGLGLLVVLVSRHSWILSDHHSSGTDCSLGKMMYFPVEQFSIDSHASWSTADCMHDGGPIRLH